jgi:amino acid adenylation domain-containing protein
MSFRMSNPGLETQDTVLADHSMNDETPRQSNQHPRVGPTNEFIPFRQEEIEQSIPERFEKIVRRYSDRLAVKMGDRALTYDQLNQAANRIARAILEKRGSGSEPIALLFEHGIDVIAVIFAVLKAGKFYVALNPSFPQHMIDYILRDAEPRLIITNSRNLDRVRKSNKDVYSPLNIDDLANYDSSNVPTSPSQHDLAYLAYTSGSTGKPRGVIDKHRNVLHSVMVHTNDMHTCVHDKLSLFHAPSVAAADANLFHSLLNGAALFPFDIKAEGISRLADWLTEEQLTICHFPVAAFRQLAELLPPQKKLSISLRIVQLSGAPVTRQDFELYKKTLCPNTLLRIQMGSTETKFICSTLIDHSFSFPKEGVPVGYAAPGKKVLLLDEQGREVGPRQAGEIAVKSRYLTLGYWRRPDLNKAKFLGDPEGGDERICLTGDLGRMLPDGFLFYLGRKDMMVKIRGYRVEIGEIESTLLAHSTVKDAGVAAWDREAGEKYLVAYVVPRENLAPKVEELRGFLSEKLPDYMIPSVFMFMDSLPLTNGKLDRRALPKPDNSRPTLNVSYVAPTSLMEKKLAQIWTELLSLDRVGRHDNFFDLGGHSLLGAKLVLLIHKEFDYDLPVSELFAAPTIAELAQRIEGAGKEKPGAGRKAWTYLCELQRGQGRNPVFVFPGGGGGEPEFFVYGFLACHVGTEYPFYGLRARGADGILPPHTTVPQMADAYVEEIRAIQPQGPYYLVGECAGGVTAYEAARQLLAQGQKVAVLALMDVERPTLTKYVCFRAGRWWTETIRRPWQENYYIARIPYHIKQFRSLSVSRYPSYFLGRLHSTMKPAERKTQSEDAQKAKAAAVLHAAASGEALRHIEWVRENYRRTVRWFRPKPYDGHIELLVSEKLRRHDPTLGWKDLALKGLSVHPIPGDHQSYLRDHMAVAGAKLRECLERAEKNRKL